MSLARWDATYYALLSQAGGDGRHQCPERDARTSDPRYPGFLLALVLYHYPFSPSYPDPALSTRNTKELGILGSSQCWCGVDLGSSWD